MSQEEEFSHTCLQYDLEAEHDIIKKSIARQLSARGFYARTEVPVQNWVVDVLVEKHGKLYAVEVGLNKPYKLPNLALFVDQVYHAPKSGQNPTKITLDDVMNALDDEVETGIKRLLIAVNKLQRFARKPQKLVIEIFPDGRHGWRFTDV
jgi:hypothetical protein